MILDLIEPKKESLEELENLISIRDDLSEVWKNDKETPKEKSSTGSIFVLDGSNVGTYYPNGQKTTSIDRVLLCVDELKSKYNPIEIICIVDAGFRHRLPKTDPSQIARFNDLEKREIIFQASARIEGGGDEFILETARQRQAGQRETL